MTQPGTLDYLLAFDEPTPVANGQGGVKDGWTERVTCWAGIRFLRGGEVALAARLAGKQPVVVTIRASVATAAITPEWRMRDTRSGVEYNIRSIVPSDDRAMFELTAESGVAV